MTFPLTFHLFSVSLPAHNLFEFLAYLVGFRAYLVIRRRSPTAPPLSLDQHLTLILGACLGALIGSKLLALLESFPDYWPLHAHPLILLSGKTIVGGLLGGWLGVELAKKRAHILQRTGDAFAIPLCLGMAIGRIGCFLTGLPDHTYGTPTNLPWAVDFGDHIPRHPTQLYECLFLLLLSVALHFLQSQIKNRKSEISLPPGSLFRLFLAAYFLMRLLIEFIKPTYKPYLGLSAIQLASLAGLTTALLTFAPSPRLLQSVPAPSPP